MDRARAKRLAAAIVAALQPLAEREGLQIRARGGRISDTALMAKIECSELSGGVAQTPERGAFIEQATLYGLEASDLDAEIKHRGVTYRIVGLSPRKRRYPIVMARQPDGKLFKFPDLLVAGLLAETRAA